MKIDELFQNKKTLFSLEVFPPKETSSIDTVYRALDELKDVKPDYMSVTLRGGGSNPERLTCKIASEIKEKYGIEPLPHLTCANFDRGEIAVILDELKEHGIDNILALRGDYIPGVAPKTDFQYASDLVSLISSRGDFQIFGACYPEGHPESESMVADVRNLKTKVDAGASHLISQLFFDNEDFYRFEEMARAAGINAPIEAGIMPITNKNQIERMVSLGGASLPKRFVRMINKYQYDKEALVDAGISYATDQIVDLISGGVQGIHLYTMNNPYIAKKIYESIKNIIGYVNKAE